MAGVYPTTAGAYSTRTWNDDATGAAYGPGVPQVGDTVYANGLAITIDATITVAALSTRPGTTAVAGGSFTTSGAVTVNADTYAGTTSCLTLTSGSGSIQNGDSFGSNTTNARYGTVGNYQTTQNGDATGGNGSFRSGSRIGFGGVLNGNTYGGSVASAHGGVFDYLGTHNGNSFGGSAASAVGTYLDSGGLQNGDATASSVAHGTEAYASVLNGNSYGAGGVNDVGAALFYSVQNGNSFGGSAAGAHGTSLNLGSFQYGAQTGGTNATAYGTNVGIGCVCVTTGITDGTGAGLRLTDGGKVILQNGTTAGQVSIGATIGRYEIGETLANYPFVGGSSGGGGFSLSRVLN